MTYKGEYSSDTELLNSTPLMEERQDDSFLESEEWNAMELEDFHSPSKLSHHIPRTGSSFGAYFNIVCVVAGTGTLGMPYALALGGWLTLALFPLAAFLSVYSSVLMIQCLYLKDGRRLDSLPELGYECFGALGRIIVYGLHYSVLLSTPCLYILFTGLNMYTIMSDLGLNWSQTTWTVLSGIFVLIPCIVLKTLKEVAWIAGFGAISTLIVVILVVILGLQDYSNIATNSNITYGFLPGGIPMALATIAFAYGGNVVYPEVESTMQRPQDWKKVMSSAMISCSIMYLSVAVVGYLAYGELVQSPILLSLPVGLLRTLGIILITLHVVLAIPISICSFSLEWERHFHVSLNYMSPLKQFGFRALIRTSVVFVLTLIALVIPFFNDLMSLIGAVSNCIMVFIFPLICHLKLFGLKNRSTLEYMILFISISVGCLGCILGAIQSIQALIDDYNGIPHKGNLH